MVEGTAESLHIDSQVGGRGAVGRRVQREKEELGMVKVF